MSKRKCLRKYKDLRDKKFVVSILHQFLLFWRVSKVSLMAGSIAGIILGERELRAGF
jgi:hypothetical protein